MSDSCSEAVHVSPEAVHVSPATWRAALRRAPRPSTCHQRPSGVGARGWAESGRRAGLSRGGEGSARVREDFVAIGTRPGHARRTTYTMGHMGHMACQRGAARRVCGRGAAARPRTPSNIALDVWPAARTVGGRMQQSIIHVGEHTVNIASDYTILIASKRNRRVDNRRVALLLYAVCDRTRGTNYS